ncbi:RICIN domain-containing protein [Saccharothrix deserti]|uniref:RICIN domain-containing protein n=1 Tax=Saccharothrix deserti TaxID=2593674 RepID=UPI00131B46FF|nr:RICIN domain-containing protein [Saccharothrix deserti]
MASRGNGTFNVVGIHSGLCLDVFNSATTNGTKLVQWTCGSGANRQWLRRNA